MHPPKPFLGREWSWNSCCVSHHHLWCVNWHWQWEKYNCVCWLVCKVYHKQLQCTSFKWCTFHMYLILWCISTGITAETLMEKQVVPGASSMIQDHLRDGTIVMCASVKRVRVLQIDLFVHKHYISDITHLQIMRLWDFHCHDLCWVICLWRK